MLQTMINEIMEFLDSLRDGFDLIHFGEVLRDDTNPDAVKEVELTGDDESV